MTMTVNEAVTLMSMELGWKKGDTVDVMRDVKFQEPGNRIGTRAENNKAHVISHLQYGDVYFNNCDCRPWFACRRIATAQRVIDFGTYKVETSEENYWRMLEKFGYKPETVDTEQLKEAYKITQAAFVKEHALKIGSNVKIMYEPNNLLGAEESIKRFPNHVGKVVKIRWITTNFIGVYGDGTYVWALPWFCLDPLVEQPSVVPPYPNEQVRHIVEYIGKHKSDVRFWHLSIQQIIEQATGVDLSPWLKKKE